MLNQTLLIVLTLGVLCFFFLGKRYQKRKNVVLNQIKEKYQINVTTKLLEKLRIENLISYLTEKIHSVSNVNDMFSVVVEKLHSFLQCKAIYVFEIGENKSMKAIVKSSSSFNWNGNMDEYKKYLIKKNYSNKPTVINLNESDLPEVKSILIYPWKADEEIQYLMVCMHYQSHFFSEFHLKIMKLALTVCSVRINTLGREETEKIIHKLQVEIQNRRLQPAFLNKHLNAEQQAQTEAEGEIVSNKTRILLVEEIPANFKFLMYNLAGFYTIHYCKSSVQGSKLLKSQHADIIVTDSWKMIEKVSSNNLEIPVIFISLVKKNKALSDLKFAGKVISISWPFKISTVINEICNLLNLHEPSPQVRDSLKAVESPTSLKNLQFVESAFKIIEENYSNDKFSSEDFQDQMGVSRTQLHRKLKFLLNNTAGEILEEMKLERASHLLRTGDITVSEAAYTAGFSHLSYFIKCFKIKHGITPKEYMEMYKPKKYN